MLKSLGKALRLTASSVAAAETALTNLAARRETLEARLADARTRLDAARSARKGALESDPAADLAPLTRSVRDVEDEIDALNGVLDDLAAQEEQQHIRLDRARDDDLRAASAKHLEKLASDVDAMAADLEAAIRALGKAANRMIGALPSTLHIADFEPSLPDGQTAEQRLVAGVVAEGLAHVLPSAFPLQYWSRINGHTAALARCFDLSGVVFQHTRGDDMPAVPTKEAAAALISDRLRHRAAEILAGNLAPELNDIDPPVPTKREKTYKLVEVYAVKNFAFSTSSRDMPNLVGARWVHLIPEDAADAAVKAGVGLRTDTAEGAKAFEAEKANRATTRHSSFGNSSLSYSQCIDLGVLRSTDDEQEAA